MAAEETVQRYDPPTVWPVPPELRSLYTHAVGVPAGHRLLLLSGQIGIAPDLSTPPDFAGQCEQAMANIEALLAAGGATLDHVVRLTFYVTRAEDLPVMRAIRARRWASASPPAGTVLVVAALGRPDLLIEIDAMAAMP